MKSSSTSTWQRCDWWFVAAVTAVVCALSIAPYIYGFIVRPEGHAFTWVGNTSTSDVHVYYTYIREILAGRFTLLNFYTSENTQLHGIFNIFWWLLGNVAAIFKLSPELAFHLVKILLIPGLIAIIHRISSVVFPNTVSGRMLTTVVAVFASGLGMFAHPPITKEWPLDLTAVDGFPLPALYYSPHFVAALLMFLGIMWCFFRGIETDRLRKTALAGFLGLILFNFHPYHSISLFVIVWSILLLWVVSARITWWRGLLHGLVFFSIALPAVLYHAWLIFTDPFIASVHTQNVTYSPSAIFVFMGYGVLLLGFVEAVRIVLRPRQASSIALFVSVWALTGFMMLFSGLPYERRFTIGLTIPLAVLLVQMAYRFINWSKNRRKYWLVVTAWVITPLLFGTTLFGEANHFVFYKTPPERLLGRAYLSADAALAMDWLEQLPLGSARILASLKNGNLIPGRSGQKVFLGHWAETIRSTGKLEAVRGFFQVTTSDAERIEFLREWGITHVFYSPQEAALGQFDPRAASYLTSVFHSGAVIIYEFDDSYTDIQ